MTTAISEVEKMKGDVLSVAEIASQTEIIDGHGYTRAGEMLRAIKTKRKAIECVFGPIKKKSFEAHKENLRQQKKLEDPLIEAEAILKRKMIVWDDEQEIIRRKEQVKLEAEARKREEDACIAEALEAEASGNEEEAEDILDEHFVPQAVVLPRSTPKLSGQSFSIAYKAQVTNLKALIQAIVKGTVPIMAIKANDVFLNQQARAMKETFNYPGVKLIKEKRMSAGSR